MIGVFFIATDWGRSNGGINSINDSLIKNLSKILVDDDEISWKLYCIVTNKMFNDEENYIESQYNIKIITTDKPITSSKIKREIKTNDFDQLFFVGHDIITGHYANGLRDNNYNSISIVLHHMDYRKYYFLRDSNPEKIREKENLQKEIITNADIIVPIGPFLKKSAHDLCIDKRIDQSRINEIIPGLENIEPITESHNTKKIILFGRLEDKNTFVKQFNLAIAAISTYINTTENEDIIVKCYGYEKDSRINQRELMKTVSEIAKQAVPVTANVYIKDEKELYNEIATASLCIMPSYYEGFGLTAYEAIAAGVPVIISQNTGLCSFLNNWNGTVIEGLYETVKISASSTDESRPYSNVDLDNLAYCINNIFSDYEKSKKKALQLRKTLLEEQCTWEYTARAFCNIIRSRIKPIAVTIPEEKPENNINNRESINLSCFIQNELIPKYCDSFCDIEKMVCKIVKYSNDRERRFTIWSSDYFTVSDSDVLKYRNIDDGTVGVLNKAVKIDQKDYPIIISNFTTDECLLVTNDTVKKINNRNMGVPDNHVLCIIAVPIIHKNILVGALTFDIHDNTTTKKITIEEKEYIINYIYHNLKVFSEILVSEFYFKMIDDINFSEANTMLINDVKPKISKREIVSFSGRCQMNCKHCFANEIVDGSERENEVSDILNSLEEKIFDVIYVSHYKENFYNQEKGLLLCEEIYNKFHCDICITTRCVLNSENIERIAKLNEKMISNGNNLTFCISIPALNSYKKIEDTKTIPTPEQRIEFSNQLRKNGITSIVTIRPLFPSSYISSEEIHSIVDKCENKVDAILTGGLCVNDNILKKLCLHKEDVTYLDNSKSEYLIGVEKEFKEVNVKSEIDDLKAYCNSKNMPFFMHSMEALNYFKDIT